MTKNNKNIIDKAVKRIVDGAHPEKIILFGSNAQEAFRQYSDLDFLIIKPSTLRRDERDSGIRKLLSDIVFPMDIFVYTPKEVEKYKKLPGSFIKKIIETGKVLYESK